MEFARQNIPQDRIPGVAIAKWSADSLREGFVPFPKRFLRAMSNVLPKEHPVECLAVILAVADFKRPNLTRLPSLAYLAFTAGMTDAEFSAHLNELVDARLLTSTGSDDALEVGLQPLLERVRQEADAQDESIDVHQ
jgi:hypothetical protein